MVSGLKSTRTTASYVNAPVVASAYVNVVAPDEGARYALVVPTPVFNALPKPVNDASPSVAPVFRNDRLIPLAAESTAGTAASSKCHKCRVSLFAVYGPTIKAWTQKQVENAAANTSQYLREWTFLNFSWAVIG